LIDIAIIVAAFAGGIIIIRRFMPMLDTAAGILSIPLAPARRVCSRYANALKCGG
jgi:hypothetical protein